MRALPHQWRLKSPLMPGSFAKVLLERDFRPAPNMPTYMTKSARFQKLNHSVFLALSEQLNDP